MGVMQIRRVPMDMPDGLMGVRMTVFPRYRRFMNVIMMLVIMAVAVIMGDRFVDMEVPVTFRCGQIGSGSHDNQCCRERKRNSLLKDDH